MPSFLVAHGTDHGGALTVEARANQSNPFTVCSVLTGLMGEQARAATCWRVVAADDMGDVDPWDCPDHPPPADDPVG